MSANAVAHPTTLLRAEDERVIGPAVAIAHRDAGRLRVGQQEIALVLGTPLPAAHRLTEGFLPRGHVLRREVGAVAGASCPIPRPRPAGATVADSASACLIPRRGASGLDQALVEHDRLQPMASADRKSVV